MKIQLTFKTPDVIDNAIEDMGLSHEERTAINDACSKWVRWGEYLNVEIDTETGTCTPIPV